MNLNEQIAAKQQELVSARDVLVDLTAKMDDSQESQDAVQAAIATVEKATAELDRLKAAEAAISKSVARAAQSAAPAINSNPAAKVKDSEKADLIFKTAFCSFDAYVKRIPVAQAIEQRYGDNEVLKSVAGIMTKAAQDPAMSNVAGWAAELVRESYGAFMDLLRGESVVPRLPLARYEFNGAASIKIPMRGAATPNLAGAFRAEGAAIRVGAMALTARVLTPKSMGVIGTWTAELMERSTPQIEALIRDAMIQDTATALDTAFLGTTAGTLTVPAGIQTYATGADTTASSGATTANIITDVRGRMQQLMGQNLGRRPVWIMNPARWIGVQLAVTAAGTPAFPEAAAGTLMGYPVVTSTNVPAAIVYLIDAAELGFAGGAPRFMGTEVATIHEEDTTPLPIVDGTGAAAQPVRSLFQTNSAALRCVWELDWSILRPGAVQTLTAVAW
jgi:HK97 family phage major capsid protein